MRRPHPLPLGKGIAVVDRDGSFDIHTSPLDRIWARTPRQRIPLWRSGLRQRSAESSCAQAVGVIGELRPSSAA